MKYFLAIDIGASYGRHIIAHIEKGKISISAKSELKALNDLLNYFDDCLIFTDEFRESLNDIKYLIKDSKVFENKNFNTNHFITFRERLILFLNENDMTSYSLANKLNVSGFVIKALENGKHTIISSINGLDVAIHIGYLNFKNKKEAKEYLRVKFNPIRRYIRNYYKSNRITATQISSKFNVNKEMINRLYNKPEENLSDSLINLAVNLLSNELISSSPHCIELANYYFINDSTCSFNFDIFINIWSSKRVCRISSNPEFLTFMSRKIIY